MMASVGRPGPVYIKALPDRLCKNSLQRCTFTRSSRCNSFLCSRCCREQCPTHRVVMRNDPLPETMDSLYKVDDVDLLADDTTIDHMGSSWGPLLNDHDNASESPRPPPQTPPGLASDSPRRGPLPTQLQQPALSLHASPWPPGRQPTKPLPAMPSGPAGVTQAQPLSVPARRRSSRAAELESDSDESSSTGRFVFRRQPRIALFESAELTCSAGMRQQQSRDRRVGLRRLGGIRRRHRL